MPTNSELLLAGYDAWNCDDCDAWLALLDREIHIHTSGVFPDLSAEYRGPEGARRFWRRCASRGRRSRSRSSGWRTRATARSPGSASVRGGVDSGVEVDMRFGSAIRVRDGLATELVQRRTFEETRAAMLEAGRHRTTPASRPAEPVAPGARLGTLRPAVIIRRMSPADQRTDSRDKAAFAASLDRHRRELQVHCYRMLGSLEDFGGRRPGDLPARVAQALQLQ